MARKFCVSVENNCSFLTQRKIENLFDGNSTVYSSTNRLQNATRFKTREEAEEAAIQKWGKRVGYRGLDWKIIEIEVFEDGDRYVLRDGGNLFFKGVESYSGALFDLRPRHTRIVTNRLQNALIFKTREEAEYFAKIFFAFTVTAISCKIV